MSAILGTSVTGAGGGAYTIDNSLRFRSSASAYLNRTPSTASGDTIWTFSSWVKRGTLGVRNTIIQAGTSATTGIRFTTSDTLEVYYYNGSSYVWQLITTQVFRDPSSWYHIVVAVDTTQATSSNRIKIYVNGSQVTAFGTTTYPSLNQGGYINYNAAHTISATSDILDGYLANVFMISGQALTASSFGETNASTGVWQPKAYAGSYGTNGFYLKFSDIATTSGSNAGLGKDFSGNGNYWNTNNISVTSGVTYDAMTDSPTPKSSTVGNFATFSPISLANASTSEANLKVTVNSGGTPDGGKAIAPFGMSDGSGKWYFEMTCVDYGVTNQRLCFGIANISTNVNSTAITNGYYASASGAHGNYNIGSFTNGDVLQVAYDSNSNKLWFGKNGTWYNSGNPASGTTPLVTVTSGITYAPFTYYASSGEGPGIGAWNFGQRPFAYTPPTGFNRLNTYNLPTPTIGASSTTLANKYFDATLWTGTGSAQSIVNSGSFQPDFVWAKSRSSAESHRLQDVLRGATKSLYSNLTNAETTEAQSITSFNSNGFSLGSGTPNTSSVTYVAWQWKANGSGVTNTAGSITSTVSANTTSGFSIVTYTGNGTNGATIGHGLGVAPSWVIVKNRGSSVDDWLHYHISLGATKSIAFDTNAAITSSTRWNNTAPSSTVVTLGTSTGVNASGNTYVAYCFAEKTGFSKFGSYTGNGSSDGVFVYLGFRPRYIMIKRTDLADSWAIKDTARNTYNVDNSVLKADESSAESTSTFWYIDELSNGFKLRNSGSTFNNSGGTYIYMAFAESPFNYSLAR